jgi:cytochrome c-type biogenesis protein CcmF
VPGRTQRVGGYDVKYVSSYGRLASDPDHTGALMTLGAVLSVSKNGHHVATLRPARNYYPGDASDGPVGQFISGDATSEVGLKAGLRKDFWVAMQPDTTWLQRAIAAGNRQSKTPPVQWLRAMVEAYVQSTPPASFRMISSPLVTWIWLGGLIVLGGGLIVLWPAPDLARRKATATLRARVAQELGRA